MSDLTADEKKFVLFHLDSMIDRAVEKSDLGMKTTGARKHHVKALLTFIVKRTIGWGKLKEKIKPEHFSGIPGKWDAVSSDPSEDSLRRARNSLVLASLIKYNSSAETYEIKLAALLQFTIERLIQPKYATDPGWNRHLIGLLALRDRLSGAQTSAFNSKENDLHNLEDMEAIERKRLDMQIEVRKTNRRNGENVTPIDFIDQFADTAKTKGLRFASCKTGKRKAIAACLLDHLIDSDRDPYQFIDDLTDKWKTLAVISKDKFNRDLVINPKAIDIEFVYIHRESLLSALDRLDRSANKVIDLPDEEQRARRIRDRGGIAL